MTNGTMLILRGVQNLLHETPAKQYAVTMGYTPEVLNASGETGLYSAQTNLAIKRIINGHGDISGIYGFSGGGYNLVHIWARLGNYQKQIKKIVVLGAPNIIGYSAFAGCEDVEIFNNPYIAHMLQPDNFLELNT